MMGGEQLVSEIARYAADKKAIDVVELDLRGVLGYTDYFLVCSGNTARQAKAIHDGIHEGLKREHDTMPRRVEGSAQAGWILMDYLDVVVHIFTPRRASSTGWSSCGARPPRVPPQGAHVSQARESPSRRRPRAADGPLMRLDEIGLTGRTARR